MPIYCTYCSADKDLSKNKIPAIKRYKSNRIKYINNTAKGLGLDFYILSGKFGILSPYEPIEHYDHLLQADEVPKHANKVAQQLQKIGIKDIVFFTRPINIDENLKPYIDCITIAANIVGAKIEIVELEF